MDNLMDTVFNSIDDVCELTIGRYNLTADGEDYFYFNEQSSLQVLRELSIETPIEVTYIFSERHRVFQKIESIKAAKTVGDVLNIILPLVENGNFPCKDFEIVVDRQIKVESHDDGEIHLISAQKPELQKLIRKIFVRQYFNPDIVDDIISRPNLYHRLERPRSIITSYTTFDEAIEAN
jgi:hypothetical protein